MSTFTKSTPIESLRCDWSKGQNWCSNFELISGDDQKERLFYNSGNSQSIYPFRRAVILNLSNPDQFGHCIFSLLTLTASRKKSLIE